MRFAVALLAAFAGIAPAAVACDVHHHSRAVKAKPRGERPPLIIGDSTMIFATPKLGRRGLEADSRGCRQFAAGVAMLARRKRAGRLPRVAILALGANAGVGRRAIRRAVRVMGPRRILGLVTPRQAASSAAAMRWAARRWPNRVLLIDWVRFSGGHGGWFSGDGLHMSHTGARAFANLVRRAIDPLVDPPLRVLRLPRDPARTVKPCGRGVFVVRGRVTCARAMQLARLPRLRPIPGWRFYDLSTAGRRPWRRAYMRRDRKVVVAIARPVAADSQAEPLRVLATGDSLMMRVDAMLRAQLEPPGRARVSSDVRAATGLTKPHLFDWMHYAKRQVRRRRPDVVVAMMGTNEAFPIGRAPCCGPRWSAGYARRVTRLSRIWRRGGARAVYWLTLPEPIPGFLTRRIRGVNSALRLAKGIGIVDARSLLTPDGVFVLDAETSPGVREQVRAEDGVHIWWAGARLVARAIVGRLEADGLLAPVA